MLKKINRIVISLLMLFICFQITYEPVSASKGPLDGLNITMELDANGKADLSGEFTGDSGRDSKIESGDETFGKFLLGNGRSILFAGFGIATLTMVIFFIISFIKLGQAADNPQERSQAIKTLLHVGIATALLGGITFIVGVSMNIFN